MIGPNLSDWSLRSRALTVYLMVIATVAGVFAFANLGRDEDPTFTIKTMLVTAVWPGATLDDDLRSTIASSIRTRLSPRHVPDEVIEAPGIPHTRTGKKLEVPVTAILAGRSGVDVDPRSIDDPGLIDWYSERGREHQW